MRCSHDLQRTEEVQWRLRQAEAGDGSVSRTGELRFVVVGQDSLGAIQILAERCAH